MIQRLSDNKKMPFSVLLSLYEKENPSFLTDSLNSIYDQTLPADEVVLVEDGPLTPELYAILNKFKTERDNFRTIKLEKNSGLGAALNEGLKHCSFDIVARMDTDDIAKKTRFEKQIKFLTDNPDIDVVGSWVDEFTDNNKNVKTIRKVPQSSTEILEYCKSRCPVNHPTVVFRKSAVLKVGGYLTQYFPEDYFLWIKMLMNNSHFFNIQESLLYFRKSKDTIRKRGGWKYAWDEIHIQKMIYDIGFINKPTYLRNCSIRFFVRIIPLSLRKFIYRKFLRKKAKLKKINAV